MKVSAATLLLGLGIGLAEGCTNILVSKGASRDGSTQVSALLQPVYFLSVFHFLILLFQSPLIFLLDL